ncbi:MAG: RelA/SpoT family protein, partial [Fusobacteriaceae bacterium]
MLADYWEGIENRIKENNLNVDIEKIKYAFILAEESHVGQFRLSGENYILHPVEVTKILIDL